ncbi:molecular chaperone [Pseudomonas chlororaphis subsp. aurantiaca]|uniref:fimbrial biogenesis chaperone n=1 Tax=Pseudomonas chlororaphis TaxID=587753 RepID=UPI0027DE2FAC|nr:molecular chaperone [Pseudomonas chlororaphis]WMI97535.1 molecular chaperone [Pseudomonas chlororaphis subsp. aurantiaca]
MTGRIKWVCFIGCFLGLIEIASAGVAVGGTRVIYDARKKEASLSVVNQDKDVPYLIQSWVESASGNLTNKAPFIITPPLFRLDAKQENILRIMRTGGELSDSSESVFWLNVKSIPSSEKTEENKLQISVKTRIKMFYRPAGLTGNAAEAYKALTFSRKGSQLIVTNNTPYYVSFFRVSVGDKEIDNAGMVAPKSTLTWTIPADAKGSVSWQAISDYGAITTAESASL